MKEKCLYLYSGKDDVRSFAEAKAKCEERPGGSLVAVTAQDESDFLSELLILKTSSSSPEAWYTAGMEKEGRWRWQVLSS